MSRLLRSTGLSKLGKPTVVGASTVFRPIATTTAAGRVSVSQRAQSVSYYLRPPATTATPVVFLAEPISVFLAKARKAPPPTTTLTPASSLVGPSTVFSPIEVKLAKPPAMYRRVDPRISRVRAPAALAAAFIAAPIKTLLARLRKTVPAVESKLRAPAAVNPSIVFRPLQVHTTVTPQQAHKTRSILRAPAAIASAITFLAIRTHLVQKPQQYGKVDPHISRVRLPVAAPVVAFLASPIRVALAKVRRTPPTTTLTATSALVGPAVTFAPIRVHTVLQIPQAARKNTSRLRPPATLALSFIASPIRAVLAKWQNPRLVDSKLRPPTAVAPSIVFSPVKVHTALQIPMAARKNTSKLRAPASLALAFVPYPIKVALAKVRKQPPPTTTLTPTAALVGPAITFGPVRVHTALQIPQAARRNKSLLRAPSTLAVAFIAAPLKAVLAKWRNPRLVESRLRPPTAVAPSVVFTPIAVHRTYPPNPTAHSAKSKLQAPTVVFPFAAFLAEAIRTTFAQPPSMSRRTKFRLSPPAIIKIVFAPIRVMLAKVRKYPPPVHPKLRPPTRVATSTQFRPVVVHNTYSKRKIQSRYLLRKPTRITIPIILPPVDLGGKIGDWDTGRIDFTDEGRIEGPE